MCILLVSHNSHQIHYKVYINLQIRMFKQLLYNKTDLYIKKFAIDYFNKGFLLTYKIVIKKLVTWINLLRAMKSAVL